MNESEILEIMYNSFQREDLNFIFMVKLFRNNCKIRNLYYGTRKLILFVRANKINVC